MNKAQNLKRVVCIMLFVALTACSQAPSATATATVTLMPTETPTSTITPIPTSTNTPEPTPIPGVQVYPVSSLGNSNPWLPLDKGNIPMTVYYGFNVNKPPFNNVLVRQAFAAAIDREQIAQEAIGFKFRNVTPATSLTPPEVLGRDLYNVVGIPFNSTKAKDLLKQAGYSSGANFPSVTLLVPTRGEAAPGAYYRMAKTIVSMWKETLGVDVTIDVDGGGGGYIQRFKSKTFDLYQVGWGADYNDPDNFLKILFHSDADINIGHFNNKDFDSLVDKAASLNDPAERQLLYIEAEKILTEQETGVIPLFHTLFYQHP